MLLLLLSPMLPQSPIVLLRLFPRGDTVADEAAELSLACSVEWQLVKARAADGLIALRLGVNIAGVFNCAAGMLLALSLVASGKGLLEAARLHTESCAGDTAPGLMSGSAWLL